MTPTSPDPAAAESAPDTRRTSPWSRLRRIVDSGAATLEEQRSRLVYIVGALAIAMAAVWTGAFAALGLWPRATFAGVLLTGAVLTTLGARRRPALAASVLSVFYVAGPLADATMGTGLLHPTLWIASFGLYGAGLTVRRWEIWTLLLGTVAAATVLLVRDLGSAPDAAPLWTAFAVFVLGMITAASAGWLYARLAERSLTHHLQRADALGDRLRSAQASHQSLVERLPVGVFQSTPDGRLRMANPAVARILGAASVDDALALDLTALYANPAQRDAFVDAMTRDGAVEGFLVEWRSLGGELRTSRIDARVTTDADGETVYEGTFRDVTDEQRTRRALARVQALQTAVLRATSDAIVVLDGDGTVRFASPGIERLLGRAPADARRAPLLDLVHPDGRAAAAAALALALGTDGAIPPIEAALAHRDGHAVLAEGVWSATRTADGGRVVSFRDATERKRAEVALREARRQAEDGVRLKNALLANVGHEIRTPLTAILGFSDILAAELGDSDHREFVDLIAESGERLMNTLSSVLDLAQLDAGRVELAPAPRRVAEAVVETARLFRRAAEGKGLELSVHVETPEAEAALDGDAFERVLRHLVGNAVKFTERGAVRATVRGDAGRVLVDISDTGIGISDAFLPHLFEAFEQESAGSGRDFEGVGVGLAVSRRLVERMGGEIQITSRKGAGTTVTLAFLRTDLAVERRRTDARPVALVLDDNPQASFVAERLLVERYRVRPARTAAALLAAADELALAGDPAAVALLDIHLGAGPTGDDVMRALRARPAYAQTPVVAVTAYALPGDRERFLAGGFDGYLTKPYTRLELFATLDAVRVARRPEAAPGPEPPPGPELTDAPSVPGTAVTETLPSTADAAADEAVFVARPAGTRATPPPTLPAWARPRALTADELTG